MSMEGDLQDINNLLREKDAIIVRLFAENGRLKDRLMDATMRINELEKEKYL